MDRASVQNLVSKLVKDAERRKHSFEKTQFMKEEEEKQYAATASQFYPRKTASSISNNTQKSESKIKQYINKSVERAHQSKEKLPSNTNKVNITREISPKKVRFTHEKTTNKATIERTVSPNKSKLTKSARKGDFELACEREIKGKKIFMKSKGLTILLEMKDICMKEAFKSNLDYLRGLREDIERIKDNIEKKIEGIEQEEITLPTLQSPLKGSTEQIQSIRTLHQSSYKPSPQQSIRGLSSHKPSSRSSNVSIERIPDKPKKTRAKSRYLNMSIKMSDNTENKIDKRSRANIPPKPSHDYGNLRGLETSALVNIVKNLKNKDNVASNHQSNQPNQSQVQINKGINTKEPTPKSNFMNDKKATSYVNQLIKDFKEIHNLRSPIKK